MNYKEAIDKIKGIFDAQAAPMPGMPDMNPAVSDLPEYILQDGTKIVVDKLEIGGSVTLNGSPAPDGSHQLQDGTVIETVSGKITEITTPAEESADESVNTDMAATKSKMAEFEAQLADHSAKHTAMASQVAKMESDLSSQKDAVKQMMALIERMATAPVAEPVAPVKNQYTTEGAEAKEERFSAIVDVINKLKNK